MSLKFYTSVAKVFVLGSLQHLNFLLIHFKRFTAFFDYLRNKFGSWKESSPGKYLLVFKRSLKTKNCHAEDVFKTSSRHVLKMSSRCLGGKQNFDICLIQNSNCISVLKIKISYDCSLL